LRDKPQMILGGGWEKISKEDSWVGWYINQMQIEPLLCVTYKADSCIIGRWLKQVSQPPFKFADK
jgi:hypothetical protein